MTAARVLIVDDSSLVRQLLRSVLSADPELEVIGTASDPIRAWQIIQRSNPDVITLDVEMPRMNGLTFLEKLMRARPMPVVVVSALTAADCETTLRALELGAVDFVEKPKLDIERGLEGLGAELLLKVKAAARARPRAANSGAAAAGSGAAFPVLSEAAQRPVLAAPGRAASQRSGTPVVIAIGASTGGTEALRRVLAQLPETAPGVIVVQHMPGHFTRQFAERLDRLCAVRVREAADGDAITPGQVLIAPGGALHTQLQLHAGQAIVKLVEGPLVNYSRPSVDVLFHSCASALGRKAVGALLTGMGQDGAEGLLAMRRAGGGTVAQDEASSVVFGMPKEAIARGAAEIVAPLHEVAGVLMRLVERLGQDAGQGGSPPLGATRR
jgi:two-component system, chemotaxis family, protein-glutamate methylesterase/glutaminase